MRKLAVFIALGLLLTGCDESSSDNAQHNSNESQSELTSADFERCWDKALTIELDEYIVETNKRGTLSLRFKDNSSQRNFQNKCDIEKVSDVTAVIWPNYQILTPEASSDYIKNKNQENLNKVAGLVSIALANGTKKYQLQGTQIFVLPLHPGRTLDNNPVTIECGIPRRDQKIHKTTNCISWSQHKSGFYIYYRFFRKRYQENDFLAFDREMVNKFENMAHLKK
jgi:major membrane immunogen (membrane-anchored lipoprotein)